MIRKALYSLYNNLLKLSNSESISIAYLLKIAGYDEEFRAKIEELSKSNPKDFSYLFKNGDRIYIPLSEQISVLDPNDRHVIIALKFGKSGSYLASDVDYINGYASPSGSKNRISIAKILYKESAFLKKRKSFFEAVMNDVLSFIKQEDWISQFIDNANNLINVTFLITELRNISNNTNLVIATIKKYCEDLIGKCQYEIEELETHLSNFINSPARQGSNIANAIVVISQDPHDIAQASFERAWTSCLNIASGVNKHCIIDEAKDGGLVAYLIREDDLEIKKPLSRMLIRKYRSNDGKVIARVEDQIYGVQSSTFKDAVNKFVNENINKDSEAEGYYKLTGGSYSDSLEKYYKIGGKVNIDYIVDQYTQGHFSTVYNSLLKEVAFNFAYENNFDAYRSNLSEEVKVTKELLSAILPPKTICYFIQRICKEDPYVRSDLIRDIFHISNEELSLLATERLKNLDCSSAKGANADEIELVKKDFIKVVNSLENYDDKKFELSHIQNDIDRHVKDIIGETAAYALDKSKNLHTFLFAYYLQEGLI